MKINEMRLSKLNETKEKLLMLETSYKKFLDVQKRLQESIKFFYNKENIQYPEKLRLITIDDIQIGTVIWIKHDNKIEPLVDIIIKVYASNTSFIGLINGLYYCVLSKHSDIYVEDLE